MPFLILSMLIRTHDTNLLVAQELYPFVLENLSLTPFFLFWQALLLVCLMLILFAMWIMRLTRWLLAFTLQRSLSLSWT